IRKSNLEGYKIPGLKEALKLLLFADDATVYLSKNNNFATLQNILDKWCMASKAKFNINKTKVIPMGSVGYWAQVQQTRRLSLLQAEIPENIAITNDHTAIRSLEDKVGNKINREASWTSVLERTNQKLNTWRNRKLTMVGQAALCQPYVGGCSQFLAAAQGMPDAITKELDKYIPEFVWGHVGTPTVNCNSLAQAHKQGGKSLLSINTRNKAIHITWWRDYLRIGTQHPRWAYVVNQIMIKAAGGHDRTSLTQVFPLQTWRPFNKGSENPYRLPAQLKEAVKVAKKYGLRAEALVPEDGVARYLPAWEH
ncbi:hypothetical protein CYLTODRAFT_330204, partial [Cylindrobasidium torrendii FP15055 ss-10]